MRDLRQYLSARRGYLWNGLILGCWLSLTITGFAFAIDYMATPGETTSPPSKWPHVTAIGQDPGTHTLLMFMHPRCACTHASLTELSEIIAKSSEPVRTYVVLVCPTEATSHWEHSQLAQRAKSLQGITVIPDHQAKLAKRFSVKTSGTVMLYDRSGSLQYSGGITASRGHEGDSVGQKAILSLTNGTRAAVHTTPIYGCALSN